MARIEPVFRQTRDAAPDPHRTYYSHSHSHYQPRYRSRGSGIPREKIALVAGIGIGLIKAGILSNIFNNGK